jgi:preprotein translocase subunit SecF
MEFFRIRRDIPFMRHALVLNVISFITFAPRCSSCHAGCTCRSSSPAARCWRWSTPRPADIGTRGTVEALGFGEVQVQNFGTSRDVLIRLPVRGNMKQTEVAGRVFDALCKAERAARRHQAVHHAAGRAGQPAVLHGRPAAPSR